MADVPSVAAVADPSVGLFGGGGEVALGGIPQVPFLLGLLHKGSRMRLLELSLALRMFLWYPWLFLW